jgi:hypothetical protein
MESISHLSFLAKELLKFSFSYTCGQPSDKKVIPRISYIIITPIPEKELNLSIIHFSWIITVFT